MRLSINIKAHAVCNGTYSSIKNLSNRFLTAGLLIPGIAAWELAAYNKKDFAFLFGSPLLVIDRIVEAYSDYYFPYDVLITAVEVVAGLILGSFLCMIAALSMSAFPLLKKILSPYILLISAIPPFAISPMLIIWFGVGIFSKIFLSALIVFISGLQFMSLEIERSLKPYRDYFISLNASNFRTTKHVIIPCQFQLLLLVASQNVGNAVTGAFIGEAISSQNGLGHYIIGSGMIYDIPAVLAGILHLSLLGYLVKLAFEKLRAIENKG